MSPIETIARFTLRPDMRSGLTMMFAGGVLYPFGAIVLGNRFVVIGGWLVAVLGVVNYMRWLFSRRDVPERTRQPWE